MKPYKEKRTLSFPSLKKNMKTLILLLLITFSNFIVSNKTKNFLTSKIKKAEKIENTENTSSLEKSLSSNLNIKKHLITMENSTLSRLTRTTAANVAFIQKTCKTNMHFKMNNQLALNSKARMQTEMQAMNKIINVVKEELKNNKDLPSVNSNLQPDLSYLDRRDYETEITTEVFSTSLRLSKEQLGRYTWAVLHSMASAYPLVADGAHQKAITSFIENMYVC